jgi:uncharacterized membrane protein YoaK (UPF0700 family)
MTAAAPTDPDEDRRHLLVLLLAVHSGATDAIGFLALGGAFTSVMTGNLVLGGVGLATGNHELLLLTASAIVCFAAGCAAGVVLAGSPATGDSVWPRPVTLALLVQLSITLGYACAWWVLDAAPGQGASLLLLLANAIGLGIQSSAVQRFGVSGLSTTYLTGTLTTTVIALVGQRRLAGAGTRLGILAALVLGAVAGALLVVHIPMLAPALQVGCLGTVVVAAWCWFPHAPSAAVPDSARPARDRRVADHPSPRA